MIAGQDQFAYRELRKKLCRGSKLTACSTAR
jgi:hypothetical protein